MWEKLYEQFHELPESEQKAFLDAIKQDFFTDEPDTITILLKKKTAALMKDVHGVSISHQSILNYENAVALYLKPFIDNYPYELSNQFCGDEIYIRVNGRWHYLFFFFDAVKKIILSYPVSENRDTQTAILTID